MCQENSMLEMQVGQRVKVLSSMFNGKEGVIVEKVDDVAAVKLEGIVHNQYFKPWDLEVVPG